MKNDKIIKIIRVAKKYYESHMDQKVIAQEEGMSVSTVSRMLKKAEEMGYIKITVEYPVLSNEELSASLKKKYNLEKVFLVPKLSDAPVAVQEDVCRAAAKDLSSYLNDGSIIGTAWGRTMKSFANYVSDLGVHNVLWLKNAKCRLMEKRMRHLFLSVQMICHRQLPEQDTGKLMSFQHQSQ